MYTITEIVTAYAAGLLTEDEARAAIRNLIDRA